MFILNIFFLLNSANVALLLSTILDIHTKNGKLKHSWSYVCVFCRVREDNSSKIKSHIFPPILILSATNLLYIMIGGRINLYSIFLSLKELCGFFRDQHSLGFQNNTKLTNMYISYFAMFLWDVVVLELDRHPDHNKGPNRCTMRMF